MKSVKAFTILCLHVFLLKGQNLLPNPSFEKENFCESRIPCSPAAWYSVSNIPYGYQNDFSKAIGGKRPIAFLIACDKEIRSYWQTVLLCALQDGETYNITFKVYAPTIAFSPEYFGIHLSDSLLFSKLDTILQINPDGIIKIENQKPAKEGWIGIKTSFVATGKEKYVMFGNFNGKSNYEIIKATGKKIKFIEYYIEDVALQHAGRKTSVCADYKMRNDSLFAANMRHHFSYSAIVNDIVPNRDTSITLVKTDTLLLEKINFKFDSYVLSNTEIIANYFRRLNRDQIEAVEITGYTDSVGLASYNMKLSEKRAMAVKQYLISVFKIKEDIITAVGKGVIKDQGVLASERRVEIVITCKK